MLLEDRRRRTLDEFACESLLPGMRGGAAFVTLQTQLVEILGDESGRNCFPEFCL